MIKTDIKIAVDLLKNIFILIMPFILPKKVLKGKDKKLYASPHHISEGIVKKNKVKAN